MSRHRNFRNYSYEDDMSDDVYGHSVEDYDMAISPSTAAQFMYRRTNSRDASELGHYIGSVVEEEEDDSEEDDHLQNSQDYKRPQLDPISEAKLSSCLDQLHSILGETCHEPTAIQAVLKSNFDIEKALDDILNGGNKKDTKGSVKTLCSKGVMALNTNTFNQSVQNPIGKSLMKEENRFHSKQPNIFPETQSSFEELSIKSSGAMVSASDGGSSPVTSSQIRLLSMPLSTILQSSVTSSEEITDHHPPKISLLSSPNFFSELSPGESQFSSIASTANTQVDKEKPAFDNKSASDPLLSSALSFSQTDNQQMRSNFQDSLPGRCPSQVSELGLPESSTSLNETELLSSSLGSLVQKCCNTAVPSQGEQQSGNKNRKVKKLSAVPLGTVSLANLASSHTSGTSQQFTALVTELDNHKAQNMPAIRQENFPSLATLAQEHSRSTEGTSSFNVLLQSAAVGGMEKVSGFVNGEHQVSEVKALTPADVSQNQTMALESFSHRTISLLDFSNDSSQSPQPSVPTKSLNSSKEISVSSSLGNVFSLSDLARAHGECNKISSSLTSCSNLSQHQKHCKESLDLSALSTTNAPEEITDKTYAGESSSYKNTSKAMQVSDNDCTGVSLLTACLSSFSVAEQQRISAIGSKMTNNGELTPQLQRSGKITRSKYSLIAKSSMFALTISYNYRHPRNRKMKSLLSHLSFSPIHSGENITAFDFSDPSPDDLVFEKQKKAFTKI